MDKLKETKILFKKPIWKYGKSMFYATDRITRTLLNKARKSLYEKDEVLHRYYLGLDDKNVLYENKNMKTKIPFYSFFLLINYLPCIVLKHPLSLYIQTWQMFIFF